MRKGKTGSRFYRNFSGVAKANIFAQGLHLLALPIYSFLYPPAAFGVFAIFSATLAVATAVSTWKFDWLIPNTDSTAAASSLACLGAVLSVAFSITIFLSSEYWLPWFSGESELSQLDKMPLLLLVAVVVAGVTQLCHALYIKRADLAQVSRSKVAQSLATVTLALVLGYAEAQTYGLIVSLVVGSFVGVMVLGSGLRVEIAALTAVNIASLKGSLRRYRGQATVSTAISLLNNLSFSAVPFLIGISFGVAEAGLYAMARGLVIAPLRLVTQSLGQSFWAEAGQLAKRESRRLNALYRTTTLRLAVISLPLALLCLWAANFVDLVIAAPEWQELGLIIPAFVPMAMGMLIFASTNHIIVFNKKHYQLVVDAVRLGATCGIILGANDFGLGLFETLFLVGLASFCAHYLLFLIHLAVHHAVLKRVETGGA